MKYDWNLYFAPFAAALLIISGCTRPDTATVKAPQPEATPNKPELTKTERLAAINNQLANWVVTGRPEDADRRNALLAERARLDPPTKQQSQVAHSAASAPVVNQSENRAHIVAKLQREAEESRRAQQEKDARQRAAWDTEHQDAAYRARYGKERPPPDKKTGFRPRIEPGQ